MLQVKALFSLENKWQVRASSLPQPFWLTSTPPALVLSFFGCKMGHRVAIIFGAPRPLVGLKGPHDVGEETACSP